MKTLVISEFAGPYGAESDGGDTLTVRPIGGIYGFSADRIEVRITSACAKEFPTFVAWFIDKVMTRAKPECQYVLPAWLVAALLRGYP